MSWLRKMLKPLMIVAPKVLRNSQTVAYPTERLVFFDRFRGRHVFHLDKCISCGICARVCPDASIELVEIKGKDKKFPQIDYNTCCLCGYCVNQCPRQALEFTDIVEFATADRSELLYSPERLMEVPDVKDILPMMKRRTEAYLTEKEMKYRKVKDV